MVNRFRKTYSKKMVSLVLTISLIDLQLSYVLAFAGLILGRDTIPIAEDLSKVICIEIIGVCVGYFCKSFFETKEEEKNKLIKELKSYEENDDERSCG